MTTAILEQLGLAWAIAATLQLALWVIQQRTKNGGIVDVGWAASFSLVVAVFAWRTTAEPAAWFPIFLVVGAWSVRLTAYLISRGAARSPEEGRYVELRRKWAANASRNLFVFFQAQAALTGILSVAFVVPFLATPWDSGWLRGLGVVIAVCGLVGEAIADAQLARFKRTNKGKVCDVGLWSWSRHPNYFFEWCVWLRYAVYGLAFGAWGLIALAPQALLLTSILFVTGIPPTEKQSLASRGDAYRAYQARVSKFIPWPPKRPAGEV